jgi:hypothetical protein
MVLIIIFKKGFLKRRDTGGSAGEAGAQNTCFVAADI